jgi:hypothetical protein
VKRINVLDRLAVMKRKPNVIETESGNTAVVRFAAANVPDTCLLFRVICETVSNRNSVEECVYHAVIAFEGKGWQKKCIKNDRLMLRDGQRTWLQKVLQI